MFGMNFVALEKLCFECVPITLVQKFDAQFPDYLKRLPSKFNSDSLPRSKNPKKYLVKKLQNYKNSHNTW